jgi:DNA-directed RNA polymerase subunit F
VSMNKTDIRKHIEYASSVVKSWPLWKQNILANSSEGTTKIPRKPITRESKMRILIASGGEESKQIFAAELARQALLLGHRVYFMRSQNAPSPFMRLFNLYNRPETMREFVEEIADFHNFCEKYRKKYKELIYHFPLTTYERSNYDSQLHMFVTQSMAEVVIEWHKEESDFLRCCFQQETKDITDSERAKVIIEYVANASKSLLSK